MENSKPTSPGRLNSLHDLVLDYISHHAYAATAKVLSQPRPRRTPTHSHYDSTRLGTDSDEHEGEMEVDGIVPSANGEESPAVQKDRVRERLISGQELDSIERRRNVLNFILNGAIMRAVDMLETYFPAVLDESIAIPTRSTGSSSSTVTMTPLSGWQQAGTNHSIPVLSHSTTPAHVKLNLQIQSFIESFRNLAPSSPSSPASSISSLTSSMHVSTHNLASLPSNGNSGGIGGLGSGVTLTNALTAAQGLHAEAKKLPPDVRAVYLQEIKDVGALFAYTDPETSILSGFLAQDRRIALADQVNLAILEERSGPAFLHSIAQRTGAIYKLMSDKGIDPRPVSYDDKRKDHLSRYWKNQTGERYRFDLHDFTELAWH